MNYRDVWLAGCFGTAARETITAYFKDGREATYSKSLLNDLKTEKIIDCITDDETGEILFYRD